MDLLVVSYGIAIVVSLSAGVPILTRGWRHRDPAVALLGAAVTIDGIEWLAWTLCVFTPAYGTPLGDALAITSRIGIAVSVVCVIAFIGITFRRDAGVARIFSWMLLGALLIGFVGSGVAVGDWTGEGNDHVWMWIEQTAVALGYGWATAELFRCYFQMRRRRALGLADPIVTNRVLLWGLWAGGFFLAQLMYCTSLALYGAVSGLDTLTVAITVSAEIALWFAVFAPDWYLRWVRGSAPAAS
jgi:hypothetical protein